MAMALHMDMVMATVTVDCLQSMCGMSSLCQVRYDRMWLQFLGWSYSAACTTLKDVSM